MPFGTWAVSYVFCQRRKPQGQAITSENRTAPRTSSDPLAIHSDSAVTLHHYNQAPGRLPRCPAFPLQPPRANWWSDPGCLDSAVSHIHSAVPRQPACSLLTSLFGNFLKQPGARRNAGPFTEEQSPSVNPRLKVSNVLDFRLTGVIYGLYR